MRNLDQQAREHSPAKCNERHLLNVSALNRSNSTKRQLHHDFCKAPHLQAMLISPTFCCHFPLHRWEPVFYRSQLLRLNNLITAPSPKMASCPPWTGSPQPKTSDPLPPKSSCQENPIISELAASRVKLSKQSR
jgi:hypothetical protein